MKKCFFFKFVHSSLVRRSTCRCAAADSWYTTGWASRGSGASRRSGHFQSVWPRRARLWCPPAGPGGQPLCILLLSGTGNRHRYSAVRQSDPATEHQRIMCAQGWLTSETPLLGSCVHRHGSTLYFTFSEKWVDCTLRCHIISVAPWWRAAVEDIIPAP